MEEEFELGAAVIGFLKNVDVQNYAKQTFLDLFQAIFSNSGLFVGVSSISNIKDIIFHVPTVIFWEKMRQYLLGTFHNFEDQVKMSTKFSDDKEYKKFTLQMLETVDKIDSEEKIDCYAQITRFYLLELIDKDLFYVLRRTILECTLQELEFINNTCKEQRLKYTILISSLKRLGLVELQDDGNNSDYYVLTDLALSLKDYALSNDESTKIQRSYLELIPPQPLELEALTSSEIEDLIDKSEIEFMSNADNQEN